MTVATIVFFRSFFIWCNGRTNSIFVTLIRAGDEKYFNTTFQEKRSRSFGIN